MFCTEKERKTCNVEKMGCEGCYYNENYLETKEAYELYFRGNPRLEKEVKNLIDRIKKLEEENRRFKRIDGIVKYNYRRNR